MLRKMAAMLLAAGLTATAAHAQKSADTLRVYWRDQVTDVDPYYNTLRTGLILAHQAWDGLVYRDPNGYVIKPLLASSWKWIDPTTLEFELRPDAKFHNGDPVTAADVVYTVKVATDPKSGIVSPSNFTWIAGAEQIDEHHVRLKLKSAFPAALQYLAFVTPIYPQAYRERVGNEGYAKAPVGAGPYRITKVEGLNEIDMERFDGYYANSSKPKPAIKYLVIHQVNDASTELTGLLGGQADWIWQFNPDQFDKIAAIPTLTAMRQIVRILYLAFEAAARNGHKTPFTDARVRQAIAYAIDRKTFADRLMQGGSRVPDALCYFTQFGCDQSAAVHYDYDPAKAKSLLADAGFANGFDTELVDGGLLNSWTGAIQGYLAAVGIRAKISTLQSVAANTRIQAGDAPMDMGSWGSSSINDVSAFLPFFFTGSTFDQAQDPELKALLIKGGSVDDPAERKQAYSAAIKRISEQDYMLPIATYTTTYAFSKQLNFTPWADEMPRFYLSSWK